MFTRPVSTAPSLPALVSSRLAAALLTALSLCCPEEIRAFEFFGVHIHPITPTYLPATMPQQLALARSVGSSMVRIEIPWSWIEARQPGRSHWEPTLTSELDSFLDEAKAYGIEVLAVVTQDPCWASSDPAKNCGTSLSGTTAFHRRTSATTPDSSWTFTSSRREEFNTGKSGMSRIWMASGKTPTRSPTRPCSWLPTGFEGGRPLGGGGRRSAYWRGATPELDADRFLGAMLDAGPIRSSIVLGSPVHSGGPVLGQPPYRSLVPSFRAASALVNHGDSRPLWITEVGWPTGPSPITVPCPDCHYWKINTEAEQAANIAFAITTVENLSYVETLILYELIDTLAPLDPNVEHPDQHIGLFRKDFTPKPAAVELLVNRRQSPPEAKRRMRRRSSSWVLPRFELPDCDAARSRICLGVDLVQTHQRPINRAQGQLGGCRSDDRFTRQGDPVPSSRPGSVRTGPDPPARRRSRGSRVNGRQGPARSMQERILMKSKSKDLKKTVPAKKVSLRRVLNKNKKIKKNVKQAASELTSINEVLKQGDRSQYPCSDHRRGYHSERRCRAQSGESRRRFASG